MADIATIAMRSFAHRIFSGEGILSFDCSAAGPAARMSVGKPAARHGVQCVRHETLNPLKCRSIRSVIYMGLCVSF